MTFPLSSIGRATRLGLAGTTAVVALGAAAAGTAGADQPFSASVHDGTLVVTGSEAADRIALLLAPGSPSHLQVDVGDDGTAEFAIDRATFTRIEVQLRNGDDRFRVNQANGAFADEELTVFGGNGDDRLDGGDGAERFLAGPGDDAVDGNRGADVGLLGSGHDTFRWDPGDGSDAIDGASGFDTMDFNGAAVAEKMELVADGERAVFFRDVANIRMDLDRVERVDLTTLGGVDSFTAGDLSGTDLRVIDVDLAGPAGGGDGVVDTVTVFGTDGDDRVAVEADASRVIVGGLPATTRIAGADTADRLQVNTLDGRDEVVVAGDVAPLVTVTVDLGPGQA
jgi:hypothetical protein